MKLEEDSKSSGKDNTNSDVKEAQLVTPIDEGYGVYSFSSVAIRKSNGELILNGIDFNYNQPLNIIYNSANSGHLSNGYFRVVHDGINVINGLTLTPIAKELTNIVNSSSKSNLY